MATDELRAEVVSLVDAKDELLVFVDLADVFFEVFRIEKVWNTSINDL